MEVLSKKGLTIRPATIQDKIKVYDWLANSNLTSEMLGPPNFPDAPIPTWEEFNQDYLNHYFDCSQTNRGCCFILIFNGEEIGQINYNEIDSTTNSTEIDIWLSDKKYTGKGFGTDAINWICNYLGKEFNCKKIYIAPSRRNINAIKAYKKVGFTETDKLPKNFIADYSDAVVLKKEIKNNSVIFS